MNASELAAQIDNPALKVVDIRDPAAYSAGRIKGAEPLDNSVLPAFLDATDRNATVVVCCYHGNSSQSAAAYLASQGFDSVFSLDGGFEEWRTLFPEHVESESNDS